MGKEGVGVMGRRGNVRKGQERSGKVRKGQERSGQATRVEKEEKGKERKRKESGRRKHCRDICCMRSETGRMAFEQSNVSPVFRWPSPRTLYILRCLSKKRQSASGSLRSADPPSLVYRIHKAVAALQPQT